MKGSGILTDVSGIGKKTAMEINNQFGYTTPKELYVSYLKGEQEFDTTIMEMIPSPGKLHSEILDAARHGIITDEDLGFDGKVTRKVKAMLFVRVVGLSSNSLVDGYSENRSKCTYRPENIDWTTGMLTDPANVIMILFNEKRYRDSAKKLDLTAYQLTVTDSGFHNENVVEFFSGGSSGSDFVSKEYIENVNEVYGSNLPYQGVHRIEVADFDDFPVKFPDVQEETSLIIAPRILKEG